MKDSEDAILAAGAQIIWVTTEDSGFAPATSEFAHQYYGTTIGSAVGYRVGDGETQPTPGIFDSSPFITSNRGFVMLVRRSNLEILFGANYSSVSPEGLPAQITELLSTP